MPEKPIKIRPYQLMCMVCAVGGGERQAPLQSEKIAALLAALRENPGRLVQLVCNHGTVYSYQDPGREDDTPEGPLFNDKRDIDILQRMGLAPGDVRPARDLFEWLLKALPTSQGICTYGETTSPQWQGCRLAAGTRYDAGVAAGIDAVLPGRKEAEKAQVKLDSVSHLQQAEELSIRPHHLMCMTCFHGGRTEPDLKPIAEDNLYEVIKVMQTKPRIPVRLVDGCCMICPPCSRFDPESGRCVGGSSMALRDRKKDLDVLQRTGLAFGDVLPAAELLNLLYETVTSTRQVCGYGDGIVRSPEWRVCGSPEGRECYALGRRAGIGVPGVMDNPAHA